MEEQTKKLTFWSKQKIQCPVCQHGFHKEELLSGGGRMNAGDLSVELHRSYVPTSKFGVICPLLYPVTLCPSCHYAAYPSDFQNISKARLPGLVKGTEKRKQILVPIFPDLDFSRSRRLQEGIATYFFAAMCYESADSMVAPHFKQGLSCLRAAWLSRDLHAMRKEEGYDYLSRIFYRKAGFFYSRAVELEQKGTEFLESIKHMGPDLDNNYGFDGVLYLSGILEFKYGQRSNSERRRQKLVKARSTVSRIVGMGKHSKSKPSALLELAKDLHKEIKIELKELEADAQNPAESVL